MNRPPPLTLEVTPATYDEIAALLGTERGDRVDIQGVELHRGPLPPLLLTEPEIDACHQHSAGPHGFARLIEVHVLRRLAQRSSRR